ncbi:uncharacterized protein LOC132558026 [Ylistrum balloti]|uniref:uncharacterized protein LOC132558026 n=1 Tax=Ylistrum balloti TaxID=509963 RepID=UPI002905D07A|nr:uncharacterized protein LOC132558026 [Ylistrum balloti]
MCQKKAKKDLDKMIKVVVKSSDASADAAKRCKDFMKTQMSSGEKSLDTVVEAVTEEVENDMRENEYYKEYNQKLKDDLYYKRYLHSCVELCWLMRLQDPPVFMMATIVAESTKDHFRAYTRSGKHFDFIVWPALFLYKDGPLLYKGVAQYTDKSKDSFDF